MVVAKMCGSCGTPPITTCTSTGAWAASSNPVQRGGAVIEVAESQQYGGKSALARAAESDERDTPPGVRSRSTPSNAEGPSGS